MLSRNGNNSNTVAMSGFAENVSFLETSFGVELQFRQREVNVYRQRSVTAVLCDSFYFQSKDRRIL